MPTLAPMISRWLEALKNHRLAHHHDRRGQRLYSQGDTAGAVAEFQEGLRLAPDRPLALMNLGLALYKEDLRREARATWTQALALAEGRNAYLEEQLRILLRQFG